MQVITIDDLEEKIYALPAQYCKAIDESEDSCGSKFKITVVSRYDIYGFLNLYYYIFDYICYMNSLFVGKPMLAQHRMVHKAIEAERKHIHALTLVTFTPEAWEKKKEAEGLPDTD